ncbi:hypothetical protein JI735_19090 [Paenibacillus sonchi]|uniref:Uncharacterized protein n=1 Tax=Paenibacillus sonchi TaxID=373687 RepID=A0A974SB19_9BACL|nr:hypothetical protein [Paenibacillus sonchi]MCE3199949.1 hypothetical protein [Paenibacillus sonchi]QQZ58839.1 hypothetical protein JI735_19090 [Paenibacillus sonchi]
MDDYSTPHTDPSSPRPQSTVPETGLPPQQHATYEENKRDFKHSGPGIASFIIALITLIGYIIAFVVVGVRSSSLVNGSDSFIADSAEAIFYLGISVLILAAFNVIGGVLGIIGLTLRKRRKVFGIIGTIINAVFLLLFMLIISTVLVNAGSV